MRKRINVTQKTSKQKKRIGRIEAICWFIVPFAIIILLVLDGMGIYSFTTERLIVIGICLLVVLLPFFSEITVKNLSIKKNARMD